MLALGALATGTVSCSLDEIQAPVPVVVTEGGEGHISILYEVEGDMPLTTRGIAASAHEKALKDVYILFFDTSDTEIADRYVGCSKTSPNTGTSTIKFDLPKEIKENTDYKILAVGNAESYAGSLDSYMDFLKDLSGDYSTVRSALLAEREEAITKENPGLLPLCGRFVGKTDNRETTFRYYKDGEDFIYPGAENCMFRFQRAICRIDLHNLVGNVLDIQQVRVVNMRSKGSFFIDGFNRGELLAPEFLDGSLGPGAVDMPHISTSEIEDEGKRNTLQRLEAELYCFPNTVNTCLPNDKTTTALMISGYYTDPENGETDDYLTYYRLNLNNAGEAQSILRNYCYRASIKGVNRRGDLDESSAYNSTNPVFKYDIGEEWNTDDDNVVTDDKGNFLVVSKSLLTFTGEQSGADVIKLTVNTSDNMEWSIEMDDKSKELFSYSIISDGSDGKIKAFTCGPNQRNTSDHYYTGSLVIVAKNKDSELRKEVQLVQLTTSADVNCLIVNDNTKSFTQQVSKYGQTISYQVVTGNMHNRWSAELINVRNLDKSRIFFNEGGTSGNLFTITFPANIKNEGSVDVRFKFLGSESTYNEGEIEDIIVTFNQDKCNIPMSIDGWPTLDKDNNAVLTLNCFDTRTGYEYSNCIAQSKRFSVNLHSPDDTYVVVTSTFDEFRDLTLSEDPIDYTTVTDVRSIHPGVSIVTREKADQDDGNYHNELNMKDSNNNNFYINAFRMGPGDEPIVGQITVQVKNKLTDEDIPDGHLTMTVTLEVPKDEYMINDVMIKNDLYEVGNEVGDEREDNGWIYIMDRNIGCDARMFSEYGVTRKNEAMWCFYDQGDKTKDWIITNTCNDKNYENPTKWLGSLEFPEGESHNNVPSLNHYSAWEAMLMKDYKHLGRMYEEAEKYPWILMTPYTLPSIRKHTAISKGRHFILADETLWPLKNGKKVKVACWLPSGGNRVGYGYTPKPYGIFDRQVAVCGNKGKMVYSNFWPNKYGHNGPDNIFMPYGRLIRLMYMIGYSEDKDGNTIDPDYTLPKDSIDSQLDYYKNHILKCYEQQ